MTNPFLREPYERQRDRLATAARLVTLALASALGLMVLGLFVALVVRAAPALSWSLLWDNPLDKGRGGGLWAPLIGTVWLVIASVLLVAPVGVAAAVYLHEYAPPGLATRVISLAVTSLAGVPSIVHALFGLGAFVLFARMGASLQAAACTLAIMNLPVVVAATREALAGVPQTFREACWNLGASKWHTLRTVVLPNSLGGILTGVIFAVSRAAGETAPILFTGAVFFTTIPDTFPQRLAPYALNEPFMALAMHLHVISTQVSQMPAERTYATAVVLVALVLLVNSAAFLLRLRLRKHRKW